MHTGLLLIFSYPDSLLYILYDVTSKRLIGRSVWNDRWLLVIPASSLSSERVNALKTFIHGLDTNKDGRVDVPGVSDIQIGFRAYSRSGN